MATFRSTALYQCLKADVSAHLNRYQLSFAESSGEGWWPDASPQQVACVQLLRSVDKKLVDSIQADAETRALEKFLRVNESCRAWELKLESSWDEELFGTFKRVLDDFFHPGGDLLFDSLWYLLDHGRTGPGASLGANGSDFYTKLFSSCLTTTSAELYNEYRRYLSQHREWLDAEVLRSEIYGAYKVVEGNRVSFVPKSNEISRTICTEPSLNMFYQLGLEQILLGRLRTFFGVNLENQQFRNRELALLGSQTNRWVTIDLSSASDSISIRMCEASLPGWFLDVLKLLRCPKSDLPANRGAVSLHMISTMGNGTTFALQTILFAAVVRAAFECSGVAMRHCADDHTLKNWGVNGDDIVVPAKVSRSVIRLLTLLGFEVNARKTFIEGRFRESCGGDFYMGHSVRGVYLKDLSSPQSRYVAINLFNDWSIRTGIALPCVIQYLQCTVRHQPVPLWENADAGVRTVSKFLLPEETFLDENGSFLYWKSVAKSKTLLVEAWQRQIKKGHPVPPKRQPGERRRCYNPYGLMLAFLRGDVVNGKITVRHDRRSYRAKQAVTPNWDESSRWQNGNDPRSSRPWWDNDVPSIDWSGVPRAELMTRLWLNFFG